MRGNKVVLSAWSAGLVFCVLQILWGPEGVIKLQELKSFQNELTSRLEVLQQENRILARKYEALRTSESAIEVSARKLGWFKAGEVPVRVVSGPQFGNPPPEEHWRLLERQNDDENLDSFFRAAWFLLFVLFYLIFFLFERLNPPGEKEVPRTLPLDERPTTEEASVRSLYAVPQVPENRPKTVDLSPAGPTWKSDFPQIRPER
jgi:cell division protein FtsB